MERSKIFIIAYSLALFTLFSGCIQPVYPPEFNFREQCTVFNVINGSSLVSDNIKCTGSMGRNGTITLSTTDSKNPNAALKVFGISGDFIAGSVIPISEMEMCQLNESELAIINSMTNISSQIVYCSERSLYHGTYKIAAGPSPNTVYLDFGNQSVVSRDSRGFHDMYYVFFMVGEHVEVVDPQTGEMNESARQKIAAYGSYCWYSDPLFHSYNCGVPGVFVAIPR